jgi:SPP1 family predicted phage head-tail adaptor
MLRLYEIARRTPDQAEFRTRVELQRRYEQVLPNGEIAREWRTYATCWCAVRATQAREFIASDTHWSAAKRVLTTHWLPDVKIADRALIDGVPYDVIGSADPYGTRQVLDIYCAEYAHDG